MKPIRPYEFIPGNKWHGRLYYDHAARTNPEYRHWPAWESAGQPLRCWAIRSAVQDMHYHVQVGLIPQWMKLS